MPDRPNSRPCEGALFCRYSTGGCGRVTRFFGGDASALAASAGYAALPFAFDRLPRLFAKTSGGDWSFAKRRAGDRAGATRCGCTKRGEPY